MSDLRALIAAVEAFRVLDPEIQAQTILTFVHIANAAEPLLMKDLQSRVGLAKSSVSRNVAALSHQHRLGKPGHGLVEAYEDPEDRRNKLVRLTPKGKSLAAQVRFLLEASPK